MSDKIVYLEKGNIVQCDTPKNIYNYPKTKLIAKSFGKANFIVKDDVEYCIRPKYCYINKQNGDIKAKVNSVINFGSVNHITVSFKFQTEFYDFLIIDSYMDENYQIDDHIYLNIDFSKAVEISN